MWNHPEAHPGEYLRVRFLEPLGLSASELARGCQMPRSRVSDILTGKRAITADTALRLAAFFRMEASFWMALQARWEFHQAEVPTDIVPLDPPGFLLGPSGATPLPARRRSKPPHLRVPELRQDSHPEAKPSTTKIRTEHEEIRYADGTRALVARRK